MVLRNRLQHISSHNLRRVGAALDELARRVGYRVIPGLGERVIYRELFPKGLTLLDLAELGEVGLGHIAARQELREMIAGLGRSRPGRDRAAQGRRRGLITARATQEYSMTHQFNRTILREYDVRGIVGSTLDRSRRLCARPQLCRAGRVGRRQARSPSAATGAPIRPSWRPRWSAG